MRLLKQGTTVVMCGPFLTTDGITPDTNAVLSTAVVFLSKNHAAFAAKACTEASSGGARGNYRVFLTTVDSGTLGPLRLDFLDTDAFLNAHEDFMVVNANVYNSLIAGTDYLQIDLIQTNGTAQTTAVSVLTTGDIDGALAAGITTLSTGDLDAALSGYSTLSTGDLDDALAAGISTLSTGDVDGALTNWGKTGFALTTAQHVLIQTGLSTVSTADLDGALTNWGKTGFALTTAQHVLIQAGRFAAGDTVGAVVLTTANNDLISSGVWEQITTEHNTTKTFGDEFQDLAAGSGLTTTQLDAGLNTWDKTGFALTTAANDLISSGVWEQITTEHNTTKTFGDEFQDLAAGSGLTTTQLDAGLTNWNKTGFALTTAQHVLIQAGLSTLSTGDLDAAVANYSTLSTANLDAATPAVTVSDKTGFGLTTAQHVLIQTGLSTLSTGSLDAALTGADVSTLSTANLDAAVANYSTLSTANLDNAVSGLSTKGSTVGNVVIATAGLDAISSNIFSRGMEVDAGGATLDFGEYQRIIFAGIAGPSTGGGGTTHSYLSADGATTRIKGVVSTDGNRSTIVYAGSS